MDPGAALAATMDTFDNPIVTFDLEEQAPANVADDRTSGPLQPPQTGIDRTIASARERSRSVIYCLFF